MGATFSAQDFANLAAFAALSYFQFGWGGSARSTQKFYSSGIRPYLPWIFRVPPWVFGPVWVVLYGLVAGALFSFARDHYDAGEGVTIAIVVLALSNLLFNKMWSPLFFGARMFVLAAIDATLIAATAIAVQALLGVQRAWLAFGLYFAYTVWVLYAMLISWAIVYWVPTARRWWGDMSSYAGRPISRRMSSVRTAPSGRRVIKSLHTAARS